MLLATWCLSFARLMRAIPFESCDSRRKLIRLDALPWDEFLGDHVKRRIRHEPAHRCRVLTILLNLAEGEVFTPLSVGISSSSLRWTRHNV